MGPSPFCECLRILHKHGYISVRHMGDCELAEVLEGLSIASVGMLPVGAGAKACPVGCWSQERPAAEEPCPDFDVGEEVPAESRDLCAAE